MIFSICVGCFILFIMLCGFCIVWKRFCCIQFLYILTITFAVLFFVAVGIVLIVVADVFKSGLEDSCSGGSGSIAEAFNELYSTSDNIYCKTNTTGCTCEPLAAGHVIDPTSPRTSYITTGGISNVQGCSAQLRTTFESYGVEFSGTSEIVEYLDLFGDIEKEYKCSGICTKQGVYYFYDIAGGNPETECTEKIKSELIEGVIAATGITYVVTGCFIAVIWFIQYGLCCRKKQQPGSESRKF